METKFDKTAEILLELKVSDIMEKEIISITPDQKMEDLMKILRENRISGLPVVEGEKLVGIISLEDVIKWLDGGKKEKYISEMMTGDPLCLYSDQPLLRAAKTFEVHGFGRCPVVNRDSGKLEGIITKGGIIESTLRQLEKEFKEEEIRQYRASHFFKDIIGDSKEVILRFDIEARDMDNAGKASVAMKRNLKRLGIKPDLMQRIAVAAYEAEMNLVLHSNGGTMEFNITEDRILVEVRDVGPGIEDVEKALQPGFTTAEPWVKALGFGAGMGLPNIKKCSDKMELISKRGSGTILKIEISTDGK